MDITKSGAGRREVTLPAGAMLDLLNDARSAGGEVVREHGRSAGRRLADRLASAQDGIGAARSLPIDVFWKRVTDLFASRGWGSLRHAPTSAGIGELRSADWFEADRSSGQRCDFTAGMIEGLLERVAGGRLEVDEVECRAAGGASCRFLFGSPDALAAARKDPAARTVG